MAVSEVDIGPLSQGHSYTTVLRYESEPIVRIPISAITCPVGAARIATTTPHGMLDGWRGTVVNVQQPKEINAEDPNNIRSSEYHSATVIDTSTPRAQLADVDDTPEIHPAHHEGLIQWVLHKAFGKPDADLFDTVKSKDAESAFVRQFGKRPTADLRKRQNANRPHRNRLHT